MRILSKCDDSYLDVRRIFYTVEIENNKVVDIMVANNGNLVYVMQNADGSTVYSKDKGNDYTFPDYHYNELEACNLALNEYRNEFKEVI